MSRDFAASSTDRIECGTSDDLIPHDGPSSVVYWIKQRSINTNEGRNFARGASSTASVFLNVQDTSSAFKFRLGRATNPLEKVTADNSVVLNVWQHVAVTWDGSPDNTKVHWYIDGVEPTYSFSTDGSGAVGSNSGEPFIIGNRDDAIRATDGQIAHAHAYDRVLTVHEVRRLMRRPGSIRNGLVGYWRLNGQSPELDFSGNGHHGTLTGTTLNVDPPDAYPSIYTQERFRQYGSQTMGVGRFPAFGNLLMQEAFTLGKVTAVSSTEITISTTTAMIS